ncbi:TPA: hypothetical protein P0E29_004706 [Vibrio harveyi]|nr:hypothetical protein [Vibrio harveyi]
MEQCPSCKRWFKVEEVHSNYAGGKESEPVNCPYSGCTFYYTRRSNGCFNTYEASPPSSTTSSQAFSDSPNETISASEVSSSNEVNFKNDVSSSNEVNSKNDVSSLKGDDSSNKDGSSHPTN